MAPVPVLVALMLATGIANSLLSKAQDQVCVANCADPDSRARVEYAQPVWQTLNMFVGESLCLLPLLVREGLAYHARRRGPYEAVPSDSAGAGEQDTAIQEDTGPKPGQSRIHGRALLLFILPSMCDIVGTTLMNIGLILTPVSIYQMTRGALVLWVGVFSVIFLRRHLLFFQWLCLALVMIGVGIVGVSGSLAADEAGAKEDEDLPEMAQSLLGVLLILFAQIFTASQFVLEEKIMGQYTIDPLIAVGCEGFFGFAATLLGMVLLHLTYGQGEGQGGVFDMRAGWEQLHVPAVRGYAIAIAFSIAFFNFFGLSVTTVLSSASRSTIDTCRTLGIWLVSLLLGWEHLRWLSGSLQALGFACLVTGTMVFNGIWKPPLCLRPKPLVVTHSRSHSRSRSRTRSRSRSRSRPPSHPQEQTA